ncbi:MAG: ROK family protein [Ferruginibacter sp.]
MPDDLTVTRAESLLPVLNTKFKHSFDMAVLGIDLGGTKLAGAIFTDDGCILREEYILLDRKQGREVGNLIASMVKRNLDLLEHKISSVGIAVPGIIYPAEGTVWAPNIPGWEGYPLLKEIQIAAGDIPVYIDSDRACYILGECWQGASKECTDAVFLAVGTGIAAGILVDGKLLRGAGNIAGAIGWWGLERPFHADYKSSGYLESNASGKGIARNSIAILLRKPGYKGALSQMPLENITAHDVFLAHEGNDEVALETIARAVEIWGIAIANLVSLFNPQKIILGGGIFGPGVKFIPAIYEEAKKWAQPISMKNVIIEKSLLGSRAGLYGAAFLALKSFKL